MSEAVDCSCLQTRACRSYTHKLENLQICLQTSHRARSDGLHLEESLTELECTGRDQDRSGHRHLLEAGGKVGRMSDGRVVHVQIALDRAHHNLTGVDADADVERHPGSSMHLLRILLDCLLHSQRRVACAYRMVFV